MDRDQSRILSLCHFCKPMSPPAGAMRLLSAVSNASTSPRNASVCLEAFISAPLKFVPRGVPAGAATTPRRTRVYSVSPQARSLESYREGRQYEHERSARRSRKRELPGDGRAPAAEEVREPQRRGKQRLPLASALASLDVASIETCGFLVRSGCVRVNGEVVRNEKAKIHRLDDVLVVNGKEYGTYEFALQSKKDSQDSTTPDVIDRNILPRSQRDFRSTSRQGTDVDSQKKYNRRVDRGFYSSRRHGSGK